MHYDALYEVRNGAPTVRERLRELEAMENALDGASDLGDALEAANVADNWLLPMAFPEGSHTHPSYGTGHAAVALTDAAMAAMRTDDSYLQALYRRKRPKAGHGRAISAVKHSMICAAWHMLSTGELYARPARRTTSAAATPNARPSASSLSSNASATPPRCKRPMPRRA